MSFAEKAVKKVENLVTSIIIPRYTQGNYINILLKLK